MASGAQLFSAPLLCVVLPQESAPDITGTHKSVRQERGEAVIRASGLFSWCGGWTEVMMVRVCMLNLAGALRVPVVTEGCPCGEVAMAALPFVSPSNSTWLLWKSGLPL